MRFGIFVFLLFLFQFQLRAAQVDTVLVHSEAMNADIPITVILPDSYQQHQDSLPVVYLLHGYSGNYTDWSKNVPVIQDIADEKEMILVCPDGNFNSWYLDSPVDPASQYETHVAEEVVDYIDHHFRTIQKKEGRAITGLSMGGHGALFLAIRHQETFGAAGSMSGGVDLTYDINAWEIKLKLEPYEEHPLRWDSLSVVNMVDQIQPDSLALIIDCGTSDFFIDINRRLHTKLLDLDIPHDYTERPGAHNWDYWSNAIRYQLLFFKTYFEEKSGEATTENQSASSPS